MIKMFLNFAKLIGKGYGKVWFTNNHDRYRCLKGARNTKKSYIFTGLEPLAKIIQDSYRNILFLRQTNTSNKKSTFNTIKRLINQPDPNNPKLTLRNYFKINKQDMQITYIPTGQVIMFGGMDDADKYLSTRPEVGFLTDIYVEEAFQLKDFEEWQKIDASVRDELPEGGFHQITFLFNAYSKNHFLYEHYFKGRLEDNYDYLETHDYDFWRDKDNVFDFGRGLTLHISTYRINEFRSPLWDEAMEQLKKTSPDLYKVYALGMWGTTTGAAYPEFKDNLIISRSEALKKRYSCFAIGIDTGLSDGDGHIKKGLDVKLRSATTMQLLGITSDYNQVVCLDEFFYSNENELTKKTEPQLQVEIIQTLREWQYKYASHPDIMTGMAVVYVDCADTGFRQGLDLEARKQGLINVSFIGSSKSVRIVDRVMFIRTIMSYGDFLVSEACTNLIREFKSSQKGEKGEPREDINDHAINANEYAWIPVINRLKRWKTFKQQSI